METHQIANIQWIIENSREFQKKSASASLTTLNLCVYHNKLWKILQYQIILPASWESCVQVRKQQLEPDVE